jgi:hypothetical protein
VPQGRRVQIILHSHTTIKPKCAVSAIAALNQGTCEKLNARPRSAVMVLCPRVHSLTVVVLGAEAELKLSKMKQLPSSLSIIIRGFAQGSSTSCVINTEHLSQALYTSFKADTNPKRAQTLDAITPISHEVSAGHIKYKVDNVFDGAFSASNAKVEREIEENIKYDSKLVEITDAEILDFSQFVNEEMADTGISDFSQFVNNDLRTTGFRRSLPYLFEIYPSKNSLTYQLIPSDNSKSPLIEYRQLFR